MLRPGEKIVRVLGPDEAPPLNFDMIKVLIAAERADGLLKGFRAINAALEAPEVPAPLNIIGAAVCAGYAAAMTECRVYYIKMHGKAAPDDWQPPKEWMEHFYPKMPEPEGKK